MNDPKRCRWPGCDLPTSAGGFCSKDYKRTMRLGFRPSKDSPIPPDTLATLPERWTDHIADVNRAHSETAKARGFGRVVGRGDRSATTPTTELDATLGRLTPALLKAMVDAGYVPGTEPAVEWLIGRATHHAVTSEAHAAAERRADTERDLKRKIDERYGAFAVRARMLAEIVDHLDNENGGGLLTDLEAVNTAIKNGLAALDGRHHLTDDFPIPTVVPFTPRPPLGGEIDCDRARVLGYKPSDGTVAEWLLLRAEWLLLRAELANVYHAQVNELSGAIVRACDLGEGEYNIRDLVASVVRLGTAKEPREIGNAAVARWVISKSLKRMIGLCYGTALDEAKHLAQVIEAVAYGEVPS